MSETNFTKLFSSITASTIWCESPETKIVWITMLAMADENGWVYASIPGLANIAQVPIDKTKEALNKFLSPDEYSRDSENEGRRIEKIDGGWAILNHPKYRKLRNKEERRAYQREYMRKRRASEPVNNPVNNVSKCEPPCTQAEAEAEAEAKETTAGVKTSSKSSPCPYQQIIDLYHEKLPMLPKVVTISDTRKRSIKARWNNGAGDLEFWGDYFAHVAQSRFLTGRVDPPPGRKQFVADIDFLIRESTMIKTQEGKYHE